ncbi:MAG: hypothetical protein GXP45_06395 [bacterium]|nr:hypothetical protein [bacterium]
MEKEIDLVQGYEEEITEAKKAIIAHSKDLFYHGEQNDKNSGRQRTIDNYFLNHDLSIQEYRGLTKFVSQLKREKGLLDLSALFVLLLDDNQL